MIEALKHVYISPLEMCNLGCKMCYTSKTKERLTNVAIRDFVRRFAEVTELQTITFCGGEVFLLPQFTQLVNELTPDYFVQIITNGSIDTLDEFTTPNMVNLIVSLDGLPEYHDRNRGAGMWQKSIAYMKKAQGMGFHLEVFSIVTKENISSIGAFEKTLNDICGAVVPVTYHPRKPKQYLDSHPLSNRVGEIDGFSFVTPDERNNLGRSKHIFPPLTFDCYQISLMSNGTVYGCCEGITPLGKMTDPIERIVQLFEERVLSGAHCVEPDFRCGL